MFKTEGRPELTGLDYDLGQALGAKLGVQFAFTAQKFDGIVPAIQAGKSDAVISAMTDTKERGGVGDANTIAGAGVPTLDGLGPVGGGDHSPQEWLDVTTVPSRVALLAALITALGSATTADPDTRSTPIRVI
ncbi:transporter substrate-binding domain-containing protein [Streptomyces sp. NPDC088252]